MTAGTEEGYTGLERTLLARNRELERRFSELEAMYDKACANLMDALERASAYRATASSLHQEIERRTGVERRKGGNFAEAVRRQEAEHDYGRSGKDRRKSWPC
jgi:hypothetical protein